MGLISTSAIVLVLASVLKAEPKCHLKELWQCEEMVEEGLTFLPKRSLPHTEEQVTQFCGILKESTNCAQKYRETCMTPIQKEMLEIFLEGVVVGQDEICNPDTDMHKNYMKHAECLNKVSQMDAVKDEFEYVLAVMEKAETTAPNKRITYFCCAFSQTYNTFSTVVSENCGDDAVHTLEDIISIGFAQLPEVMCNGFDANDDQCKSVLPPEGAKPSGDIKSPILNILKEKFNNWLE